MITHQNSRRRFIQSAALAAGTVGLAGCTTATSTSDNTSEENRQVRLPDYQAFAGVAPTLPGDANGVQPYFEQFPPDPARLSKDKPGKGGTVTAIASLPGAPPVPLKDNPYWRELNDRLGVDLQITMSPSAGYPEKFTTLIAGGDVPDLAEIRFQPKLPQLLEAQFADLTEFLSGDRIKDYPALANIPTYSWKSAVFNGGIYGIPQHRPYTGVPMTSRMDIRRELGVTQPITTGEEFLELCRALTDPRRNRWSTGSPLALVQFFVEMLGGPNQWHEDAGVLTNAAESEQTTQALSLVAAMWKEGLFHPDSFAQVGALTPNPGSAPKWFLSGAVCLNYGGSSWIDSAVGAIKTSGDPDYEVAAIPPPKYEGGGIARKHLGTGVYALTGIKKSDKSRVQELLRVVDWLSAPFGTEEQLFRRYGVKDRHYTLDGSDPIATTTNRNEILLSTGYLGASPIVNYAQGHPTVARSQYDYQKLVTENGLPIPTLGYYSAADQEKGAALERVLNSLKADIIQGRKPISAWKLGVEEWRRNGGDQIRSEYQQAFQDSK